LYKVFHDHYTNDDTVLKCQASDCIGIYGLLRHFVETRAIEDMDLQRASYLAACAVVDILLQAKRGLVELTDAAVRLNAAAAQYFDRHKAAYGTVHIKPKMHWIFDLADQFNTLAALAGEDGDEPWVPDAFVIERSHISVKESARHVHYTKTFEASVLKAHLCARVQDTRGPINPFESGLRGDCKRRGGVWVSERMEINSLELSASDVVELSSVFAIIEECILSTAGLFVSIRVLERIAELSTHSVLVSCHHGRRERWVAAEVREVLAWYRHDVDTFAVLCF
jgi:hypothetical protein